MTYKKPEVFNPGVFIRTKLQEIRDIVGTDSAMAAVSGGVDSAVAFLLAKTALGGRCFGFFIENGLMRKDEPEWVKNTFADLGCPLEVIDAQTEFGYALANCTNPEKKREAITKAFYAVVFREQAMWRRAPFLVQGTIRTDVEETVAGIKNQHNVLTQIGVDTQLKFGYTLVEPLVELRKPQVRAVATALELPDEIVNRMPFPGPGLACRIIGEVTPLKLGLVREATEIVEQEFIDWNLFQCMAILHEDYVTGMLDGRKGYGRQIEVRAWQSKDATTATPFIPGYYRLERLSFELTQLPGVVSAVINFTPKPPSTMEAV